MWGLVYFDHRWCCWRLFHKIWHVARSRNCLLMLGDFSGDEIVCGLGDEIVSWIWKKIQESWE